MWQGFIASSFMSGRTLSSYYWGKMTDRYGRKTILVVTLAASSVLNVALGLCTSFPAFIATRFLMGFFNCVPGVLKTVISESSRGDREWEQNTMGLVFGMWGAGFLIAPLVSGWLADPLKQYDNDFVQHSFLTPMFRSFPFFLPNLFGAVFTLLCVVWLAKDLEETLPAERLEPLPVPAFLRLLMHRKRSGSRQGRYKRVRSEANIGDLEVSEGRLLHSWSSSR